MVNDNKTYLNIGTLKHFALEGSSIELNRLSSGKHTWSIKIYGTDPKQILKGIKQIDKDLELLYGIPVGESGEK